MTLNARLLVSDIKVSKPGSIAVHLAYGHDANGRILSQNDLAQAGHYHTYAHDDLGRLTNLNCEWGNGSAAYDALGNIRQKYVGARSVHMQYDTATGRIASYLDSDLGVSKPVLHDASGNVTDNGKVTLVYDATEQPVSMGGAASGSFAYDGHYRRAKQVIDGETVYSFYDLSGALLHRDNVTTGVNTDYIRLAGELIARRTNQSGDWSYLHPDHLGSAVAATDPNGALLWREHYTAYGEKMLEPAANDNHDGFTGHVSDEASGLTYMQARYYDPVIARFLSADPVGFVESGFNPQMFNRYSYALNNPVNAVDPDGRQTMMLPGKGSLFHRIADNIGNPNSTQSKIISLTPAGDVQAIGDAVFNPSPANIAAAVVGLAPGAGDLAAKGIKAADRANDIQKAAGPGRQGRTTTAVVETAEGTRVVGSSEPNLRPAQRDALVGGEVAASGPGHAEVTAVNAAREMGLTPTGVAASRPICSGCADFLKKEGVEPLTPLKDN